MIDERHQELASMYAFDLLEGDERAQFELALARDPELQTLVVSLRETAAALARSAPVAEPPPALKARLLASITRTGGNPGNPPANIVPFRRPSPAAVLVPWALAAGFALCTVWLGERSYVARTDAERLAEQRELAEVTLKSVQAQLDAERLLSARVATDFNSLKTTTDRRLADARETLANAQKQVADARGAQSAAESQLADLRQTQLKLTEQLTAAEQAETRARAELVTLNDRITREGNLDRLKIATLASMLNNSPQALAVAVWDPTQKQGVFTVDKLPASTPDQRYELWVIDTKPVSAGVFSVGPDGRAKITFKPTGPIQTAVKFAVSREKNDGLSAHATPGQVIMISE